MHRREFLRRGLSVPAILCAQAASCDPQHAGIRVVDSSGDTGGSVWPPLPAGQTITRRYTLFNSAPVGARLQVKVQPRLRPKRDQVQTLPGITRAVTVPASGQAALSVEIPLPMTPVNTLLELTVSVTADGKERAARTDRFLIVPPGMGGAQAIFLDRDDRTKGNWRGSYGKQAFFLPIRTGTASFSSGVVLLDRGLETEQAPHIGFDEVGRMQTGFEVFTKAATVDDPRIPFGGNGLTTRDPIAFSTRAHSEQLPVSHTSRFQMTPFLVRVDTRDDQPHRLSLYFVDYNRAGRAMNVDLYDQQGHLLVSQRLANYGEGVYLRFPFRGSLVALITPLTKDNPTLSGAFVDPDAGEGLLHRR